MPQAGVHTPTPVTKHGTYHDIRDEGDPLAPPACLRQAAHSRIGETYTLRHRCLQQMHQRIHHASSKLNGDSRAVPASTSCSRSLYERRDDKLLVTFLRCKRFDVDAAFKKYTNYCRAHAEYPWLREVDPTLVHRLFTSGAYRVLPKHDRHGRLLLVMDFAELIPIVEEVGKGDIHELVKAVFGMLELVMSDVRAQIQGLVILGDLRMCRLPILSYLTVAQYQMCLHLCQHCCPIRARGMYLIHEPWYVRGLFKMLHPFMKPSVKDAVKACGTDVSIVHGAIDQEYLPPAFGGTLGAKSDEEANRWAFAVKELQAKWANVTRVAS